MKNIIALAVGIAFLFAWPLKAAERKHDADFCLKHCTSVEISREIKQLENQIELSKNDLKKPGNEKLATIVAKKEEIKKHLKRHEDKLTELRIKLEALEKELY
ncbi:MAG: hypothetical protein A3I11_06365 [Elusimicrobia bacterium RIFCSPLOWO2_02_FULL_39_32]|nr:MAG: hypothetical protein A2034_07025 [Elusimicrobia bacterium GWA2_38_7]OGR81191.1 MAG: hypothetical protein A3B80_08975 [Elusimicrobia bacterium RIFCSPHIGHO2_02_FULL_39_36]OGR91744.1 MAG: hypothetical protein A3I11_06365 [Elusimicrobia bacterium RIFCSPLOWO2_02_FULL_39_32]OGR98402.1 MAG: hypothetical protein A3G85_02220 [Elusimicrobia bacterium RIFCSPLOWO2_12_FULL_39_28]